MMLKNLPKGKVMITLCVRLFLDWIAAARALLTFKFTEFKAISMAHINFYTHINKWRNRRKEAQSQYVMESRVGIYERSIIWDYFIRNMKKFNELKFKNT